MNESNPCESRSILLVDDDPSILRILDRWLTLAGFRVTRTGHARAAMQAIEREVPAFIVTDWEMPEIDGLELCRWIRRQTFPHYVYTMFLTSRNQSEDMIRGLDSGADDFLRKPVTKGELLARLNVGQRILAMEQRLRRNDAAYADDICSGCGIAPDSPPDNAPAVRDEEESPSAPPHARHARQPDDKSDLRPWSLLDNECASLVSELQTLNGQLSGSNETALRSALRVAERFQSLMCEWQTYSRHLRRRTARSGAYFSRHDPVLANV